MDACFLDSAWKEGLSMIFLFRKMTALYLLILVGGCVALFATHNEFRACIWVIICALLAQVLAQKQLTKINALRRRCELGKYVEEYEKILARNKKDNMFVSNARKMAMLNLMLGYIESGRLDDAERLMFEDGAYIAEEKTKKTLNYRLLYYNYMTDYYMARGELDKAEESLAVFRELVQEIPTRKPYEDGLRSHHGLKMQLELERGNLWEAEPYYEAMFERLPRVKNLSRMSAVLIYLRIAKIHWWKNEREQLEETVRFVQENGGDSCYGAVAARLLETEPDHEPILESPDGAKKKEEAAALAYEEEDPPLLDPDEMEDPPLLDPEEMERLEHEESRLETDMLTEEEKQPISPEEEEAAEHLEEDAAEEESMLEAEEAPETPEADAVEEQDEEKTEK